MRLQAENPGRAPARSLPSHDAAHPRPKRLQLAQAQRSARRGGSSRPSTPGRTISAGPPTLVALPGRPSPSPRCDPPERLLPGGQQQQIGRGEDARGTSSRSPRKRTRSATAKLRGEASQAARVGGLSKRVAALGELRRADQQQRRRRGRHASARARARSRRPGPSTASAGRHREHRCRSARPELARARRAVDRAGIEALEVDRVVDHPTGAPRRRPSNWPRV